MRNIFLISIGLVALGCAHQEAPNNPPTTMTAPAPSNDGGATAYTAPKGNFTMNFPKTFKTGSGDTMLRLVLAKNEGAGHIAVDVPDLPFHLPGFITVDRVDDGYIKDQKKRMKDLQVTGNADQMLAGAKAKRISAKGTADGKPIILDAVVAVRSDVVYVLSSEFDPSAAGEAKAAMDQIISSWKWTK